ncbi:CHY zinc finger protein [Snodgrassella alvi]|uniref:CHY zinc finger protein n=1 Tax=Snodgrassella alvi TaxID=1196083 RepID=UPI000C1F736F
MILGIDTDSCGRCTHYHTEFDIAALQCAECRQYYACFKCHDQLCNHKFVAMPVQNSKPVMCGKCRHLLTYAQYQQHRCPFCQSAFNPRCGLHKDIYFK